LVGVVTVFHDVTDRKRLQMHRDALVTLITHDLKNHLGGETVLLALLVDQLGGKIDSEELELVSILKQNSEKFLSISNALLELSRTDLIKVDSCQIDVDLPALLKSVIDLNLPTASLAGVELILDVQESLPSIKGIPSALHQVFHNLIQNAARVSATGQTVRIVASHSPSAVVIQVIDNGPGIPAEQIEKLFRASQVATKLPTSSFSTGFALYLCRLLIEAHGGKISCASEIDKGTTFAVEFSL
jgi:signal transduction histidine kinase